METNEMLKMTLVQIEAGRSSPGVQKLVSYLGASMTLEEAATAFQAIFPLKMSARQVLNLMEPVGEALICQEDSQTDALSHLSGSRHADWQWGG